MSRKDNIRNLITEHQRRLQKLKEQWARLGVNTPPEILIEIEDIEARIEQLQRELEEVSKKDNILRQRVQIYMQGDFPVFTSERRISTIVALAALMEISPEEIEVYNVSPGSIVFELGLPSDAVQRLRFLLQVNNAQLRLLKVEKVIIEKSGEIEVWVDKEGKFDLVISPHPTIYSDIYGKSKSAMGNILWVDDNFQTLKGLIRPLERAGYSFDIVNTIALALEKLRSDVDYDLAIIDILLPLDKTVEVLMPECIKTAGKNAGEGLIVFMREELGLKIPIIVMSVLGSDARLANRLEPYEISYILNKGELTPTRVKETVEQALDEYVPEREHILNLHSKSREERSLALYAISQMKQLTPKLHRALVWRASKEDDSELSEHIASILKNYPLSVAVDTAHSKIENLSLDEKIQSGEYDVFLSHNSVDKPVVEIIARQLVDAGIRPWLDKWNLIPGEPWQEGLEEALDACPIVAVFLGPKGISPWENEEMRSALEERVRDRSRRVIPVLLPGAPVPQDRSLPRFLRRLTWVDFRRGLADEEAFQRLVAGIRGVAPGGGKARTPPPIAPDVDREKTPSPETDASPIEEQASLKRQLAQHHSNLNKLREQATIYGAGETPLHLLNKIEAEETEIQRIEELLRESEGGKNN